MKQRMRATLVLAALALASAGAGATRAEAQAIGLPVYNNGVSTGFGLSLEAGFPNDFAGGGYAVGAQARVGLGPLGIGVIGSRVDPSGPGGSFYSVGANLNYKIFGGPLIPLSVTLQGGAAYASTDLIAQPIGGAGSVSEWHVPIGLGIGVSLPSPAFSIRPWVAPRVDITRVAVSGGGSTTTTKFGASAGVDLNMVTGLGIHAAYDRVFIADANPSVIGVGLSYALRVPGL